MSFKKYFIFLSLFLCLGSFTQENAVTRAAYATSRSPLTNVFNVWMANRDTLNYIGLGVFCTCALGYALSLPHYFKISKQLKESQENHNKPAASQATTNLDDAQKYVDFFRNSLYPIAFSWLSLSLKPEALLGVITSYVVWKHKTK